MKSLLTTLLLVFSTHFISAQVPASAAYKGGEEKMMKFIASNFKIPKYEKDNNIQGRTIATFNIVNGYATNVNMTDSVSPNITNETIRVISLMRFDKKKSNPNMLYKLPITLKYN